MKNLLEAVHFYFEGIHECGVSKLKEVFHPESSLFDADNGNIFVETIDSFLEDVSTKTSPASIGQIMKSETLMIDCLSPIISTVKIRIQAHNNFFVDHLAFRKS
jgi:hypothetical protein